MSRVFFRRARFKGGKNLPCKRPRVRPGFGTPILGKPTREISLVHVRMESHCDTRYDENLRVIESYMSEALKALSEEEREHISEASMPDWLDPMLAKLTHDYFSDKDWLFERKLDGERVIALTAPYDQGEPESKNVHFVTPKLVCEVAFSEWTRDDCLRHPRFKGLRRDKDPQEVHKEIASQKADL